MHIRHRLKSYCPVSSRWISSSDLSFVIGSFRANTNVNAAINAKKPNVHVESPLSTSIGNAHVRSAHQNQCVILPKTCPFARTLVGKTSEIRTQITAPSDSAKAPINSISEPSIKYPPSSLYWKPAATERSANSHKYRTDVEQILAPELVDKQHSEHRENKVCHTDED